MSERQAPLISEEPQWSAMDIASVVHVDDRVVAVQCANPNAVLGWTIGWLVTVRPLHRLFLLATVGNRRRMLVSGDVQSRDNAEEDGDCSQMTVSRPASDRAKVDCAASWSAIGCESPLSARNVDHVVPQSEVWQFSKAEGRKHQYSTRSWTSQQVHLVCCCGTRETPFPMMRTFMDEQRKVRT
jgi:hypothetical protein